MNTTKLPRLFQLFCTLIVIVLSIQVLAQDKGIYAAELDSAAILDGAQTTNQADDSQPVDATTIYNYSYTLEKGDCLSKGYRRLISKFMFVQSKQMSLGQRLYIEVKLSNADTRSTRTVFPGEIVVSGSDIDQYATQFAELSDYVRSVWEQQIARVNFNLGDTRVRVI